MGKTPPKSNLCIFEAIYQEEIPAIISEFLKKASPLSGRSLRQFFFKGLVRLNHRKAHSQAKIKSGDLIQVYGIDEEFQLLTPESMALDIIYENNDLLIVNKPSQIAVHPSGNIISGTLANGIAAYFTKNGLKIKVRPVNRLDYGTSGLIIFAKSANSQEKISEAIQKHQLIRIYYAVVQGNPFREEDIINLPIQTINGQRVINVQGKPAITHYRVLLHFRTASLLEINLETGRTHQIRVHLSHIGHPILGDLQYGGSSPLIKRPALHAGKLIFLDKSLNLGELIAPLPDDIEGLVLKLKNN